MHVRTSTIYITDGGSGALNIYDGTRARQK
jgi:hypothetical protein